MTNNVNTAPVFRLNGLYVKDISFENPRAPAVFLSQLQTAPKMAVNLDVGVRALQGTSYEVTVRVTAKAEEEGKTMFLVEVLYGGVFTINPDLAKETHEKVLFIDCANVIFPFARRVVSDLTSEGGFPPLVLEPINFEALYLQRQAAA